MESCGIFWLSVFRLIFSRRTAPISFRLPGQESGAEVAARAVAAGAFVAIAHPQWSGLTLADARGIAAAHAVEIYNHGCATGCDRPDGFAIADHLLSEGRKLSLIATDDAHFSEPDHFGGWVMVKALENTPDALLAALKQGDFYSTQGPELRDVRIEGDVVVVESSAVASVVAIGWGTGAKGVHGHSMTRTEVPLARLNNSPWVRVAVIDAAGKRAWSNPIWTGADAKNPRVMIADQALPSSPAAAAPVARGIRISKVSVTVV